MSISIHAPARGATSAAVQSSTPTPFQSTPPRGGRPRCGRTYEDHTDFNPRPREGGDSHGILPEAYQRNHFNPRPREGGDLSVDFAMCLVRISIHAPARGATPTFLFSGFILAFQSTPPRGGRRHQFGIVAHQIEFQSTPPRGGRPRASVPSDYGCGFQSTPPRGGRLYWDS